MGTQLGRPFSERDDFTSISPVMLLESILAADCPVSL